MSLADLKAELIDCTYSHQVGLLLRRLSAALARPERGDVFLMCVDSMSCAVSRPFPLFSLNDVVLTAFCAAVRNYSEVSERVAGCRSYSDID